MNKKNLEQIADPFQFFLLVHKKEIKWILLNSVLYSLGTLATLGITYCLSLIIDAISSGNENLKPLIVFLIIGLICHELVYRLGHILEVTVSARIRAQTKKVLFAHSSKLSFGYFADHFAGQIAHQISTAADSLEKMKTIMTNNFIDNVWLLLISSITLSLVYSPLGIAIALWGIFFIVCQRPLIKNITKYAKAFAENESNTTGSLVDMYANIGTVKVYSKDAGFHRIYKKVEEEYRAQLLLGKWDVFGYAYQGGAGIILGCIILFITIYAYVHGFMTVGQIVLVSAVGIKLLDTAYHIGQTISEFIRAGGECSQALKDILTKPAIDDGKREVGDQWKSVEIAYEKVSFSYNANKKVLEHFSLTIPAGQKIGIVGLSGAGKTTMMNLLLRFFDPEKGKIRMNGIYISTITQDSLRSHISFISQDTSLFHLSIAENIEYGSPASREKILEVAKMAYADEFISGLPKGYDTIVGERGVKLSGGQRQRIAIARAMLKNSPLFLLDEATSALDSDSESKVQEALKILMQGKTVVAIAHRLSTLQSMDRIVFMEGGKIIEDGTHEELISMQGNYAKLWSMQVGGFLPPEI